MKLNKKRSVLFLLCLTKRAKHDEDIENINVQLHRIESNSKEIEKNTKDFADIVVAIDEVIERIEQVEESVNSKVSEIEKNNNNVARELEARWQKDEIESMIKS